MKLNTVLCVLALAVAPLAVQATPVASTGIDYVAALRLARNYHVDRIDKAVGLSTSQRLLVGLLLDEEADRIQLLQREYHRDPNFPAAMEELAAIQMKTVSELRELLTPTQFSQMRPVVEERCKEVVAAVSAQINTAYYQAALDAGFNPET